MKIALVHDHLSGLGGAEVVLRELVALFPGAPLFTFSYLPEALPNIFPGGPPKIIASSFQNFSLAQTSPRWFLPAIPGAFESYSFRGFDLILSSSSGLAKGIVTHPGSIHVSYCHTPTRYLWSDAGTYLEELRAPSILRRVASSYLSGLRTWDWAAAQRIDHFIANSHFIAARIQRYYQRLAEVVYPPVDLTAFEPIERTKIGNYYLLISRLRPYKRVDLVVEAFNRIGLPLIIVGVGSEARRLIKRARPNITFRGWVGVEEKAKLLRHARALIHPQEEDFGLTPLESFASGRPVIAFRAGGALETVCEGQNGVFFEEQSWESLAHTVVQFEAENFDPRVIRKTAERFGAGVFREKILAILSKFLPELKCSMPILKSTQTLPLST